LKEWPGAGRHPALMSTGVFMLTQLLRCLALPMLIGCSTLAVADSAVTPALGYGKLGYPLPAAGSYALPPLGVAADGEVLDATGDTRRLYQLFEGKYVLLGFVYSSCSDVNGCPLTAHVFYQVKAAMQEDPELARQLKLVSLSFDPQNDTPQTMALYANNFKYAGTAFSPVVFSSVFGGELSLSFFTFLLNISNKLNDIHFTPNIELMN